MAGQIAVCNGTFIQDSNGFLSCSTSWVFQDVPPSDLSWLKDSFSFDATLFSAILGVCVLIFIIAYSIGHVARNFGRV